MIQKDSLLFGYRLDPELQKLFQISTEQFSLEWNQVSAQAPNVLVQGDWIGHFKVSYKNPAARSSLEVWRKSPKQIAESVESEAGPALFEQTNYQIYLKGKAGHKVDLVHRDPVIRQALSHQEKKSVLHGVLNFRGQIGRSRFTVLVNNRPAVDIEVEVFPTKMDYEKDFKEIVADIQEILASLAYEYLRSTYQLGKLSNNEKPSRLEWLLLLRNIATDLEKAVTRISHQPIRKLIRERKTNRFERIKRTDALVRSQIRRGKGKGRFVESKMGMVRERLVEQPTTLTLNTMEHRWIRRQLTEIQRGVSQILSEQNDKDLSNREKSIRKELSEIEQRVARMLGLEPFRDAIGKVSQGFASLQLLSAPGYRETYQLCQLLKSGLRLEGQSLRLSVKDLNVLYEYWTFLSILRIMKDRFGKTVDLSKMFRIRQSGIGVKLTSGRRQAVTFIAEGNRKIKVTYNPKFGNCATTLIPQKPDILISFEEENWPRIQLICDAKYRIETSKEYARQYNSFGPPPDAINVLHRYRDAILEFGRRSDDQSRPKRSVIQAAAIFPFIESNNDEYRKSRLWQSMDKFGVGAIPALPRDIKYLDEWLTQAVREGGWALADRVVPHHAEQKASDWRVAASEAVLVGVIPSKKSNERLSWILHNQLYYHPLPKAATHRHFHVKQVALFSPKNLSPNGITHVADVVSIEVLPRKEIQTPWQATRDREQSFLVYHIDKWNLLNRPIENTSTTRSRFRQDRWTSRLGLERASVAAEIILETEPEWRLYDALCNEGLCSNIGSGGRRITLQDSDSPEGRAWLKVNDECRVRVDGSNGYLVQRRNADELYIRELGALVESLRETLRGTTEQ